MRRLNDSPASLVVPDNGAAVIKGQFALQLARPPAVGLDGQPRAWGEGDFLITKLFRQIEGRQLGLAKQLGQKFLALCGGDAKRSLLAQAGDPIQRARRLVRNRRFPCKANTRKAKQHRSQIRPLGAAPQLAGELVISGLRCAPHIEPELPRLPLIPVDGDPLWLLVLFSQAQAAPAGLAQRRKNPACLRSVQAIPKRQGVVVPAAGDVTVSVASMVRGRSRKRSEDPAIVHVGQPIQHIVPQVLRFRLGPSTVHLRIAEAHFQVQLTLDLRFRNIDDVEQFPRRGPDFSPAPLRGSRSGIELRKLLAPAARPQLARALACRGW